MLSADYFDSVRDEACNTLVYLSDNFLSFQADFNKEQADMLQMLRANVAHGWSKDMAAPVKQMADVEKEVVYYLFTDAQAFIQRIITVMMDEVSTRESLGKFVIKVNQSLPFLIMNDFRVSHASNSLQRLEVLKNFLSNPQSDP